MSKQMRFLVLVSALLLATGVIAGTAHAAAAAAKTDTIWPADAIKWEDGPAKGTHVAKLWGDWMKGGPYGVLIKFDAGLMNPLHKHTQNLKIVVLSGTFVHHPEGGVEAQLGPGSYAMQRGGKNHVSGCAAGSDCEFFMTSGDKFDMVMAGAEPAAKK